MGNVCSKLRQSNYPTEFPRVTKGTKLGQLKQNIQGRVSTRKKGWTIKK